MIDKDLLKGVVFSAFSPIYDPATVEYWGIATTRNPSTGVYDPIKESETECLLQRDNCTERQTREPGYSAKDSRFLMLQEGVERPSMGDFLVYGASRYKVQTVDSDPLETYWDIRASLMT